MSIGRRVVEEYSQLLARAFNGAITVNGQRIVAHPSGTLVARPTRTMTTQTTTPAVPATDRDLDWSDV